MFIIHFSVRCLVYGILALLAAGEEQDNDIKMMIHCDDGL